MKAMFLTSDWKEQIEAKELNKAIKQVFDGHCPSVIEVTTGSDDNAILVASGDMSSEQAQELWDNSDDNTQWNAFLIKIK